MTKGDDMPVVNEIAPDVFRICTYFPEIDLQFNQFLVRDEEPLLFHTGLKELFPQVQEAVKQILDPRTIRWIGFSHLEADECGALREWQELAPDAEALCSIVAKLVSIDDFVAKRPARGMADGETFSTGKYRFRFLQTPHVPHCWEAGLLFEETNRTLFCSDLLHQNGNMEPLTGSDVVERFRQALIDYQKGPLANYLPYTVHTSTTLQRLASLKPETLAIMHGSAYSGNGEQALLDYSRVLKEIMGEPSGMP
jgi:flavorubredoxin